MGVVGVRSGSGVERRRLGDDRGGSRRAEPAVPRQADGRRQGQADGQEGRCSPPGSGSHGGSLREPGAGPDGNGRCRGRRPPAPSERWLGVYFIRVSTLGERVRARGSGGRAVTVSSANSPFPVEVGPDQRRQLTVVFTDLAGSTALASAMDPEDWRDVLDAYQHRVASVVRAHGGMVSQFQGDGAVVYFGYPIAVESASRDAVDAGLGVVVEVAKLTRELPPELGLAELQARVGIHTGEVVVASVTAGGNDRPPDVWGQVPHVAARLQSAGRPGQVVISGDTAELVLGYFDLESLGLLSLNGIPKPTPGYVVVRRRAVRHRLEAKPLAEFVRRPATADWLRGAMDRRRRAERHGPARAPHGRAGHRQVTPGARVRPGPRAPGAPRADGLLQPPRVAQPAASLRRRHGGDPGHAARGRGVGRRSSSAAGPALLVVEDGHWADPSTVEAAQLMARGGRPMLVLVTSRPELAEDPNLRPDAHHALGRAERRSGARPAGTAAGLVRSRPGDPRSAGGAGRRGTAVPRGAGPLRGRA